MTFPRKIILLSAVALAISLGTACSFFDEKPAANHQTAEPTATSQATNSALPSEDGAAKNAAATQSHLEVWPESHWPGFALRQADVLQSYTA